jgi:hypothetical protein
MTSTNTVILIFAELPRDEPFDQEMPSRRETANVENVRSMTRTWQFARVENSAGSTYGSQGRLGLPVSRNSANSSAVIGSLK